MIWLLSIIVLIVFAFLIYINARLFAYIKGLEAKIQTQIELNQNLHQSLKELVQEDFLLADGRLKKFMYQKEQNRIYNGIKVQDEDVNF
jgi:predicted Holliday junction resolvase-like endonuclease